MALTETVVITDFEVESSTSLGFAVPENWAVASVTRSWRTNFFTAADGIVPFSGTHCYAVRLDTGLLGPAVFSIRTSADFSIIEELSMRAGRNRYQDGTADFNITLKAVVDGSVASQITVTRDSLGEVFPSAGTWTQISVPTTAVTGEGFVQIDVSNLASNGQIYIDYLTSQQLAIETVDLSTKSFSLNTVGVDAAITKHTVSLGSKSFSLSTFDVEVVEDKIIDFSPKTFSLNTYPISIFSSGLIPVHLNTKTFEFSTFDISAIKDEVIHFPAKELTYSSVDIETFYGFHVGAGQKTFSLQLYDTELDLQYSRDFPLLTNSPYTYEIKGVNASCVSGFGTFDILSEGEIIHTSVEFNTSSGNTALSGTINKGSDLTVNVYAGENLYRSLRIDFALLRVEE